MSEEDHESPSRKPVVEQPGRDADPRYELGVLFVHGIGNQKRGEHLVQMGEALVRWLDRWIEGPTAKRPLWQFRLPPKADKDDPADDEVNPYSVCVTKAYLVGQPKEPQAPASAEMSVELPGTDDAARQQRWLLAESHWADEFLPPTFLDFCRWGFFVVPWTLASHFGTRIRRAWEWPTSIGGPWKWLLLPFAIVRTVLLLVFAPIVAALGALLVSALLVIGLVPLPWIRRWLGGVQRMIAGTLGDSLILLERPLQTAAIISRAARDIDWIRSRCDRLAIVAHSQGAAVAHRALATGVLSGDDAKKRLLFTFGSGLRKLENLQWFRKEQSAFAGWLAPLGLAALIASFFFGWVDARSWIGVDRLLAGFLAGLGLLLFTAGLGLMVARVPLRWKDLDPVEKFGVALRWCDRWAAADPVPNGPLFDEAPPTSEFSSEEHANYGSTYADHTVYHRNPDGFMASLAQELAGLADLRLTLRDDDASVLVLGRLRRAFRVRLASMARWIALCAAIGALLVSYSDGTLIEIGARIFGGLERATAVGPDWASNVLEPVTRLDEIWLGALGIVVGMSILYAWVAFGWKVWNWFDIRHFFHRVPYRLDPRVLIWVALAVGVGAVTVAWVSRRLLPVPVETDSGPLRPLTFFCLVAFGALVAELIGLWMAKRPRCDTPSWLAVSAAARALVAASASFYVLYPSALLLWRWRAGEGGETDPWVGILNALALLGGVAAGALSHRLAPELDRLAAVWYAAEELRPPTETEKRGVRGETAAPPEDPRPPGPG